MNIVRALQKDLAGEAGFGDDARIYSASIAFTMEKQDYDLQKIVQSASVGTPGDSKFALCFYRKRK